MSQSEGSNGARDPWNWNLDKGVLSTNRPNIVAISSVWQIPGSYRNTFMKQAFGGWELTGIFSASSGAPLTIRAGVDQSLTGQGLDTADLVGNWRFTQNRTRAQQVQEWPPSGRSLPRR